MVPHGGFLFLNATVPPIKTLTPSITEITDFTQWAIGKHFCSHRFGQHILFSAYFNSLSATICLYLWRDTSLPGYACCTLTALPSCTNCKHDLMEEVTSPVLSPLSESKGRWTLCRLHGYLRSCLRSTNWTAMEFIYFIDGSATIKHDGMCWRATALPLNQDVLDQGWDSRMGQHNWLNFCAVIMWPSPKRRSCLCPGFWEVISGLLECYAWL